MEIFLLIGNLFYDHLQSVDYSEDDIDPIHYENQLIRLPVPGYRQAYTVQHDADKDESIEDLRLCNILAEISHSIARICLFSRGFHQVAVLHHFQVLVLQLCKLVVMRQFVLLQIEPIEDDTDEQVENKQEAEYHEDHEE